MIKAIFFLFAISLVSCAKKEVAPAKSEHLEAELIAEVTSIEPGKLFWVALKLEMEESWHVNWLNPGDAGLAPTLKWALPQGFTAGDINWPIPKRIPVGDMMLFGYDGTVLLPVEITPPSQFNEDEFTFLADCDWVVCGDVCIPGEAKLSLTLPVKKEAPQINTEHAAEFASTRNNSPIANGIFNLTASASDNAIHIDLVPISGEDNKIESIVFFPEVQGFINNAAEQRFSQNGIGYQLEIDRDQMYANVLEKLKGIIVFKSKDYSAARGVFMDVPLSKQISFQN